MLAVIFNAIGILVFLFIFWKRLKEDYVSNMIFTTSFYTLLGALAGHLVSFYFLPEWWFWTSLLGLSLGLVVGILRYRLRTFETIDAFVPGLFFWLSMVYLKDAILNYNLSSLFAFIALLSFMVIYFVLDNHYKRFAWYRSGRIGFSGFTLLGVFFLVRSLVAATFPNVLSFVGTPDIIISAVMAFSSFLSVFNLSRSKS